MLEWQEYLEHCLPALRRIINVSQQWLRVSYLAISMYHNGGLGERKSEALDVGGLVLNALNGMWSERSPRTK